MSRQNQNLILVVGRDAMYLSELLRREGVYADSTPKINREIIKYKLAIICEAELDKEDRLFIDMYCQGHGKLIIINPDDGFLQKLNLKKKGYSEQSTLLLEGYECQISECRYYDLNDVEFRDANTMPLIGTLPNEKIREINYRKNKITVIMFDFLKSIYLLTHGRISLPDRNGVFRSESKIIVEKNKRLYPQADLLVRCLISIIESYLLIPRVWYLPYKKKAGVIFSYDSDNVGDKELMEIIKFNKEAGISATTFILLKTGTPKCWQMLDKAGDVELHQAYMYFPNARKLSFIASKIISNPIAMFWQRTLLNLQMALLRMILNRNVEGIRNHGLVWHKCDSVIKWMQTTGIKFDSTLGSGTEYGYMYGTALPYFLRFSDYNSSGILEFPLHLMDHIVYTLGYDHRIKKNYTELFGIIRDITHELIDNSIEFNSVLTFDFHHKFLRHKEIIQWYRDIINYAMKKGLHIDSMRSINDYWRKRDNLNIVFREFKSGIFRYDVQSNSIIKGATQILPLRHKGRCLRYIKADNKNLRFERFSNFYQEYAMFELELNKVYHFEVCYK